MKKGLLALGGVLVVVLAGAVIAPSMIDWNQHKPKIQSAISDATGYEVTFGGKIALSVLPFPRVMIENLSVKVPGAKTEMLALKRAEVSVALAPLFRGEISVSSVNLVDPVIQLSIDRNGVPSWQTEKIKAMTEAGGEAGKAAKADGGAMDKFALNTLSIQNGMVQFSDARKDQEIKVEKINLTLNADTLNGPFKAKGNIQWDAQRTEFDLSAGRIDRTARTMPVQASVILPAAGMTMNFAGVAGIGGALDLQGEAKVQTSNLSAALTSLSGNASTLPPLAMNIQGLVTAKDQTAEIKDVAMTLGEARVKGSVAVSNLSAKDGPVVVQANLESTSPIKVENFMPGKSIKTVKPSGKDSAAGGSGKTFLPESVTIPVPVDMTVQVKLAGVSYKGAELGGVTMALDKKGRVVTINSDVAQMPGGGAMTMKGSVTFGSTSQGAKGAGVVYSDPTLSYDIKADANAPARLFAPFLPEATMKSMQPLFKDKVTLNAKGAVRPARVGMESGAMRLGATALTFGESSFARNAATGRDQIAVTVSGQDINIDHFTGQPAKSAAQEKVQTAQAPAKPIQETLKTFSLPFDLTLKADFKNLTLQGTQYAGLAVDGTLAGKAATIRSASLRDMDGNIMQASGSVQDITTLTGVDVTAGGKTADAIAFLSSFKMDTSKLPKDFGPLDLNVTLRGANAERLDFIANAKALGGEGSANGEILKALSNKPAVDKLSLEVKHPNFEDFIKVFNPAYKAGVGIRKDMNIRASINQDASGYSLSGLNAVMGGMTVTGDVRANTTGAKPTITANLKAGTIPLDILSGKDRTAKTMGGAAGTVQQSGGQGDVRWSRNAINTAWMHNFNLDLKVAAESVVYGNWTLNDTVMAVTLKDGVLALSQMDAKVYGGTMNLTANVKSTATGRDPIVFDTKAAFKDVALEPLAASFSGARVVKARGDVSLTLDASSSGVSPAALISALRGSGKMDGRNVVLQGFDLAAMSRSLVSTSKVVDNLTGLANAAFKGGETVFDSIDGPFTINEGVIAFDRFIMTGPSATITNKGQVNLPRWVIDMTSTIDLVEPEDAPNLDVRFQGPLDKPGNTFAGNALESYIGSRVTNKLQEVITDKIGDKNPQLNNLLNNVLGGGRQQAPMPAPAPAPTPTPTPAPAPEATPAPEPEAAPQQNISPEEQIMRGVLEGIMGQ